MSPLEPLELLRYARHLVLPEIGEAGQARLKNGSVLLVGAGGLGSPLALYLAAAGVGRIGIVEFDRVDATNLQRQVLFSTGDVGREKIEAARDRLSAINPLVCFEAHSVRLTSANALDVLRDYEVVADGSDNFATRYLVNDACVLLGKPDVYGSIFRFEGQASVFDSRRGPCYRCLFPEPPPPDAVPSCSEAGVLGILPGTIGLIQATEVIKLLLGIGEPLIGRLLLYDALKMDFREVRVERNADCPMCGPNPTIRELVDYDAFCGIPGAAMAAAPAAFTDPARASDPAPGSPKPPAVTADAPFDEALYQVEPAEVQSALTARRDLLLLDVREPYELRMAEIPGAMHIPMMELPARVAELDPARSIVVLCHHGGRSFEVMAWLRARGFSRVWNLQGGIDAWSRTIDPTLRRY